MFAPDSPIGRGCLVREIEPESEFRMTEESCCLIEQLAHVAPDGYYSADYFDIFRFEGHCFHLAVCWL